MVYGSSEASGLVVVELRDDLRVLRLVWVGSKLHCDWLRGSGWLLTIKVFDGLLCLGPLVKPYKSHPTGRTWIRDNSG